MTILRSRHRRRASPRAHGAGNVLTVAFVNNMPDAAFRATEQRFCNILSDASEGMTVQLKLYAPPDPMRSGEVGEHIRLCYDKLAELEEAPLDGMIVTGSEPVSTRLEDEPLWQSFRHLVDFAESAGISAVWSCMAAHAAVYRLTGQHRQRLEQKLSGVYSCKVHRHHRAWSLDLPTGWTVPHSRVFGLTNHQLRGSEFSIYSSSAETGPDIFTLDGGGHHLFLQGHPEYSPTTLVAEYRRDIRRYFNAEQQLYPQPPRGYYGRAIQTKLQNLELDVKSKDPSALMACEEALLDLSTIHDWQAGARSIYRGWLQAIALRHQSRRPRKQPRSRLPAFAMLAERASAARASMQVTVGDGD